MRKRLTKIYTRKGDDGQTSLGNGKRVPKESLRVEAYGTVDELNSVIGLVIAFTPPSSVEELLKEIQQQLFSLGGELSTPGRTLLREEQITWMEERLDYYNGELEALAEFILPGGSRAAAFCHQARTLCRRAERRVAALHRQEEGSPLAAKYLNRLSDLLFVLCRSINKAEGVGEPLWHRPR